MLFNAFVKIIVCLVAAKIMEKKRIDSYGLFDSVSRKKKKKKEKRKKKEHNKDIKPPKEKP